MERGLTVGCSEKDVWMQVRFNTPICLWILFYLYFDYIFTLYGLDKNLNKTEKNISIMSSRVFGARLETC